MHLPSIILSQVTERSLISGFAYFTETDVVETAEQKWSNSAQQNSSKTLSITQESNPLAGCVQYDNNRLLKIRMCP